MNTYRYVAVWRWWPNGRLESGYIQQPNFMALIERMIEKFPDADEIILVETRSSAMISLKPKERVIDECAPERRPS